jgi:hypothetical protein
VHKGLCGHEAREGRHERIAIEVSRERPERGTRCKPLQSLCPHRTVREAQCEHGPEEKRRLEVSHRGSGYAENKKGHVKNVVGRHDAKQRRPIDPCDLDLARRPQQKLAEETFEIEGLSFTPVEVEHLLPTVGIVVDDGSGAIIYISATGPTDRIWQLASSQSELKCVITAVSFSDDDDALARAFGHMTPGILAGELKKLFKDVSVLITHTKPGHLSRIEQELRALNLSNVELIEQDKTYTF